MHGLVALTPSMLRAKPMMSRMSAALTARTTCEQQSTAQGNANSPPLLMLPSTAVICLQEGMRVEQSASILAERLLAGSMRCVRQASSCRECILHGGKRYASNQALAQIHAESLGSLWGGRQTPGHSRTPHLPGALSNCSQRPMPA